MEDLRIQTQRGFTLLEVVIVLAIIGVLTTLAIINFRGAKVDLQRQGIARELKVYLERARFDSVKRRAAALADQANIVFNGPSSFTAHLDFDEDGVLRPNEIRTVDFRQRASTQIVVSNSGLAYPITIRFDQRGQVIATDNIGTVISPIVFTICSSSDCSSTSPDRTLISLSPSGTVAFLRNGQLPSNAPAPVISNTSPTLNCYVQLSNSTTTCRL